MGRPVPILLLVRELGIGGCERDLAKIAKEIDRERFEPHVCALYPEGVRLPELQAAGVPVFHLPVRSLLSFSLLSHARLFGRYVFDRNIQLIHCFDFPTEILAIPFGRYFKVPVLIKSNLWYRNMVPGKYRALLSATDRLSDAIIVNSRAVRNDLVDNYGISPERLHLCYNGVESTVFYPDPVRAAGGPDGASLIIGAVCALRPEKRLDWLLEAFAIVRRSHPGVRLLIVGSGPVREQLEAQRQRLGIVADSHFEPIASDVATWLRKIDIFVLSSESESFPNALLEAMACGCSVMGSRVGGVPELIQAGQNGLLFEPGNVDELATGLNLLLDRRDLRRAYGLAAARTAREQFPIQATVTRAQEIYTALLIKSSRARRPDNT
jgi:L-malate glycosyltransferase